MKTLHFAAASLAISAVFAVAQNRAPLSGVPCADGSHSRSS